MSDRITPLTTGDDRVVPLTASVPELDPLPYRYLNNSNIRYESFFDVVNGKAIFEPRPGYEQDGSKYEH